MATTIYIYDDGTRVPNDGKCIRADHFVTTLQVEVRSMKPITGFDLKQLVQTKYEVIGQPEVVKSLAVVPYPKCAQ